MDSNFKEVIVDRIDRIVKIKGLRPKGKDKGRILNIKY